jgi:hypothetical protein
VSGIVVKHSGQTMVAESQSSGTSKVVPQCGQRAWRGVGLDMAVW